MSEANHRPAAYLESELVEGLEPDQLAAISSRPLPQMTLTPGVRVLLWILRLFVLLVGALVVYTFCVQVAASPR